MRRAITIVEVLVVVGILAVIAGLIAPALQSAKKAAKVTAAAANLRQIQVAASLYRTEYDGDGKYGLASQMGLPVAPESRFFGDDVPKALWASPCGTHPSYMPSQPYTVGYLAMDHPKTDWARNIHLYEESAVLTIDGNCNDPSAVPDNPYQTRFALGCQLSGTLVRRRQTGDMTLQSFWGQPVP